MAELTIKLIDPVKFPLRGPRCSATVTGLSAHFRRKAGRDINCERGAAYSVNGQPFCETHAGKALLRIFAPERKP